MNKTLLLVSLLGLSSVALAQEAKPPADAVHANIPATPTTPASRTLWSWQPVKAANIPEVQQKNGCAPL